MFLKYKTSGTARVASNAAALYLVQFAAFLVPLLEIRILAPALGPELYGQILFCQALALTASLIVEYGFNINAAQQLAVSRGDPGRAGQLFTQVLTAKILLAVVPLLLILGAWQAGALYVYVPNLPLLLFVLSYFVALGFSPMWFFQGKEAMVGPAALQVVLRLAGTAVLALVVHEPQDFYRALPILAIPPLLVMVLTTVWAWRCAHPAVVDIRAAWRQITAGFHFFVFRGSTTLLMSSIPMFLGFSADKRAVGEYAPPEKLVKGMITLIMPFLSAAFPAFAKHLGKQDGVVSYRASVLALVVIAALLVPGITLAVWLGPQALDILLGGESNEFATSWLIYQTLIVLVPLRILNQSMAMLLLIPAGRAQLTSYLMSGAALLSILVGTSLAVFLGGMGMACGLVACEGMLFVVMVGVSVTQVRGHGRVKG